MNMVRHIERIPPQYRLSVALVLLDRLLPIWDDYYVPLKDIQSSKTYTDFVMPIDLVSNSVILGKHRIGMETMMQRILFISRWKYVKEQVDKPVKALQNENLKLPYIIEQIIWVVYAVIEGLNIKHKEEVSSLYLLESIQLSIWLLSEQHIETEESVLEILKRGLKHHEKEHI